MGRGNCGGGESWVRSGLRLADWGVPTAGVGAGLSSRERSRRRCRYDSGCVSESVSRNEAFSRRVESKDMDLPHCLARGGEPKAVVVPAQGARNFYGTGEFGGNDGN